MLSTPPPEKTLAELRRAGYRQRSLRQELLANLEHYLSSDVPLFPGILGYDDSVVPAVENALQDWKDWSIGFGPVEILDLVRLNPSGLRMLLRMWLTLNEARVVDVEHNLPTADG